MNRQEDEDDSVAEEQRQEWSVPISTSNDATGATLVWRRRGRTFLTAIVKATFALVPDGVMTPVPPEPIARDEQEYAAGLRTAGDLVPFRTRADVLITGHAFAPPGAIGASVPVRFTVSRDGAAVLDKSLALQVPPGAPAGIVRLFGLGPLSRHWPIRSRLIGAHDPHIFEGATIDLPPDFDESYFQAAPIDQRLDRLRGDEQIAFERARPAGARIETRLPGARASALLHGPSVGLGNARPIQLVMDTLHVDLDRWVCNVTWRGVTPVLREEDLAATHLSAVVELSEPAPAPAVEPAKASLPPRKPPPPRPPPRRNPAPTPGEREPGPIESTVGLSDEMVLALKRSSAATALPFATSSPRGAQEPPAERLVSPLTDQRSSRDPLEAATMALSLDDAAQLRALRATPFERSARAAPATPSPSPRVAAESHPIAEVAAPPAAPLLIAPRAAAGSMKGLSFGASFLAAMALLAAPNDHA